MKKLLFKYLRKDFVKFLNSEKKPVQLSQLVYRFEHDNHKYYGFPENLSLPIVRFIYIKQYMMYQQSGITFDEAGDLLQIMQDAVNKGLNSGENYAQIVNCLTELRRRRELILHPELALNQLAMEIIREDEDPNEIDWDLHKEKVKAFREVIEKDGGFFFQLPELKKHIKISKVSPEEFTIIWQELILQQVVGREVMNLLKSNQEPLNKEKTSTIS